MNWGFVSLIGSLCRDSGVCVVNWGFVSSSLEVCVVNLGGVVS